MSESLPQRHDTPPASLSLIRHETFRELPSVVYIMKRSEMPREGVPVDEIAIENTDHTLQDIGTVLDLTTEGKKLVPNNVQSSVAKSALEILDIDTRWNTTATTSPDSSEI